MGKFDWGGLVKAVAPSVITLGTSLVLNNQAVQKAKGEANLIKEESDKAYAIALQQAQNLKDLKQASKAPPEKEKSKLPLYIGLGFGGVVVLGVVIFAVTRSKS
jgi:hypothetical protein